VREKGDRGAINERFVLLVSFASLSHTLSIYSIYIFIRSVKSSIFILAPKPDRFLPIYSMQDNCHVFIAMASHRFGPIVDGSSSLSRSQLMISQ